MSDLLNWLNDITGIAGFAFAIWAYVRERGTRKRLDKAENDLKNKQKTLDDALDNLEKLKTYSTNLYARS